MRTSQFIVLALLITACSEDGHEGGPNGTTPETPARTPAPPIPGPAPAPPAGLEPTPESPVGLGPGPAIPDGCGDLCGTASTLPRGQQDLITLQGSAVARLRGAAFTFERGGVREPGLASGAIWRHTQTDADLWFFAAPSVPQGSYDLVATLGADTMRLPAFISVTSGAPREVSFAPGTDHVTVTGSLVNTGPYCSYSWDLFGELPEPCQRFIVRTPAAGSVEATLTWTPTDDWMSLHEERPGHQRSFGNAPPLSIQAPAEAGEASVVVGIHGAAFRNSLPDAGWPWGATIDYTLELRFFPSVGGLRQSASSPTSSVPPIIELGRPSRR